MSAPTLRPQSIADHEDLGPVIVLEHPYRGSAEHAKVAVLGRNEYVRKSEYRRSVQILVPVEEIARVEQLTMRRPSPGMSEDELEAWMAARRDDRHTAVCQKQLAASGRHLLARKRPQSDLFGAEVTVQGRAGVVIETYPSRRANPDVIVQWADGIAGDWYQTVSVANLVLAPTERQRHEQPAPPTLES